MHEYPKVKVLYWKGEGFNYPEINQYGIDHATGEYLLFLNNDTEMIGNDCIKEMLSYCMREDVGAVGARMYYEDGTLQHGGVIIGLLNTPEYKILYHWRACEGSTAGSADNKSYIVDAGAKAVRAHYRRMGIEAEVIPTKYPGMYRTKYPVKQTPKISVIIPNKDHTDDLIKCLRSICRIIPELRYCNRVQV